MIRPSNAAKDSAPRRAITVMAEICRKLWGRDTSLISRHPRLIQFVSAKGQGQESHPFGESNLGDEVKADWRRSCLPKTARPLACLEKTAYNAPNHHTLATSSLQNLSRSISLIYSRFFLETKSSLAIKAVNPDGHLVCLETPALPETTAMNQERSS